MAIDVADDSYQPLAGLKGVPERVECGSHVICDARAHVPRDYGAARSSRLPGLVSTTTDASTISSRVLQASNDKIGCPTKRYCHLMRKSWRKYSHSARITGPTLHVLVGTWSSMDNMAMEREEV